jgi:hypothetical protein
MEREDFLEAVVVWSKIVWEALGLLGMRAVVAADSLEIEEHLQLH